LGVAMLFVRSEQKTRIVEIVKAKESNIQTTSEAHNQDKKKT
jgi:hypothetical protein